MITLSAAVMAHPSRAVWAGGVAARLGIGPDRIVWDRCGNVWDTARRAWLAFDPGATHHLVIQDDALPCRDIIAGVETALEYVPDTAAVSLYMGMRRPQVRETTRAAARAREAGAAWTVLDTLNWGVAVILPTSIITAMIAWCDTQHSPADDIRLRRYLQLKLRWPVWHTWPSLVDHRDTGSLVGNRGQGRVAHAFAGKDVSALDIDWSRGHVTAELASRGYGKTVH